VGEPVTSTRPVAVLAMAAHLPARLFPPPVAGLLHDAVDVDTTSVLTEFTSVAARATLADAEVLVTGWGCPPIDADVLAAAPRLRAVVHAAGSVKGHVGQVVFDRGIVVSSAANANALPVAEYTLAMILLANKDVLAMARRYRERRDRLDLVVDYPDTGNLGATVGIVGASVIGRRVLALLAPFDLRLLLADPYVSDAEAVELGAEHVELTELCTRSDVVSVHAPSLPETRGMISAALLAALPDGATLINTSRGALVDQDALVAELATGRISAVLDVTEPEVPPADSPLWDLPTVLLTPHAAGALGTELARLGACAADEVARFATGRPLRCAVDPARLALLA
jgi:phosphoglycerate dehydrogenase-like enzyme